MADSPSTEPPAAAPVSFGSHHGGTGDINQAGRDVVHHVYARPAERLPVPRQLPAGAGEFVGRDAHLARLGDLLGAGPGRAPSRAVAVVGAAGVGKTALALRWARGTRMQYADGDLYINLRGYDAEGPADPEEVLDDFLRALDVPPRRVPPGREAKVSLYRAVLATRRLLVVLDNAATAAQVRPLLPGSDSCAVLITSRSRLAGLSIRDGVVTMDLDLLSPGESVRLLTRLIGPAAAADPAGTAELASLCGYLPLALRVVAERARSVEHLDVREVVADLRDGANRLDALAVEDDDLTSIRSVFSWSYRNLDPDRARTFRLIGLHPGPDIGASAAAALTDTTTAEARRTLDALAGVHLVDARAGGRYQLHDLLKVYAMERCDHDEPAAEVARAQRRELEWYLLSANNADRLLKPGRRHVVSDDTVTGQWAPAAFVNYEDALRWFEAERTTCVAAVRRAAETGFHDLAWRLALALNSFFNVRWHIADWTETATVGVSSARHLQDPFALAWSLTGLGGAQEMARDWERAIGTYETALGLWQECDDAIGRMLGHHNLGNAYREVGRLDDSRNHELACLAVAEDVGSDQMMASSLFGLGVTSALLAETDEAVRHLERAIEAGRACDDKQRTARSMRHLADVHRRAGSYAEALAAYQEAGRLQKSIGDRRSEADTLMGMGAVELAIDHPDAAGRAWRAARDIFAAVNEPLLRAEAEEALRRAGLDPHPATTTAAGGPAPA